MVTTASPTYATREFEALNHSFPRNKRPYSDSANQDIPRLQSSAAPAGCFELRGLRFCSRHEAVCGIMLERYIPGFRVIDGHTFQVPIGHSRYGHSRTIDFRINGVFLEYHHVQIDRRFNERGDFDNWNDLHAYRQRMQHLNGDRRSNFEAATRAELTDQYWNRRREMLSQNPDYLTAELVVVTSPAELYDKIIKRFGGEYPSKEMFLATFEELLGKVAYVGQNKGSRKRDFVTRLART